jgi:hypothetical protein
MRGDFSDWTGWEHRNEWAEASYRPHVGTRWRLESVPSIAILAEQGIGDEIMFASCLPEVMARVPEVVLECEPRLQKVMERSFGIKTRPRGELTTLRPEAAFLPIGDLPRLFRKRLSDFPRKAYLRALPEMVEKWSHLKGRVGIAWRGRSGRFMPKELGLENPVCLQYDAWPNETEGMTVPDIDLRDDVEDILGICANLDRVVTVGQTIVHFAGAIGTKVDVIKAPVNSGRVLNQFNYRYALDPMPWYPAVRVYDNLKSYKTTAKSGQSLLSEVENDPFSYKSRTGFQ